MSISSFFFFNDTATTEIYTLSLHDALPISQGAAERAGVRTPRSYGSFRSGSAQDSGDPAHPRPRRAGRPDIRPSAGRDRKSTRLNSSHQIISYAVFCLKKKKNNNRAYESMS